MPAPHAESHDLRFIPEGGWVVGVRAPLARHTVGRPLPTQVLADGLEDLVLFLQLVLPVQERGARQTALEMTIF